MSIPETESGRPRRRPFVLQHAISVGQTLFVSVVAVTIIVVSSLLARNGTVPDWEESVLVFFNDWADWLEPLMWVLQQVGVIGAPIVAGLVVYYFTREWLYFVAFAAILPLKLVIEKSVVKRLVERDRPFESVGAHINVRGPAFEGLSFPSGHATTVFAVAILLAALLPPRWRMVPVAWAVIVGIARLYYGEHNFLDVVAGAAMGTLFSVLLWFAILNRVDGRAARPRGHRAMIASATSETARGGYVREGPHHREHIRSPVDILRLIVALVVVVTGVFVANVFDSSFLGLSEDGASSLSGLPQWVRQIPATALAIAVLSSIVGALLWALATTRYRRFIMLLTGVVLAGALSLAVGEAIYAVVDGPVRDAFDTPPEGWRLRVAGDRIRPGDPVLAAAIAVLGVSTSWLRRSLTQRLAVVVAGYIVTSSLIAEVPALGVLSDIGLGLMVASGVLLVFGRHDLAPNKDEIHDALESVGVDIIELDHLDVDARGSAPWIGTSAAGERIFVKALGRDERSADLMFRAYRWFRLRKTGDHHPFVSLHRAVEHEALVSLQARALGVRTPRILGVTDAGVDGMVLAYEAIDGRSADQVEDISDDALESIWTMVSLLHSKRIAHRDLRLANVSIDGAGGPWLVDFAFSELAAADQELGTDVAELLASTAAVVGVDRAVRAAHVTSGVDELSRALPWLQPLALSAATREPIGKDGIEAIRTMLIERCQMPAEEPAKLQRIDTKALFIIASLVLSSWFLVPQLADIDNIWEQVRTASVQWALVAGGFSVVTYLAATVSLLGAIPYRLHYLPAFVAQLASSFANRVTPARVGGVATNVRYFQKQGIPTAVSVTAVGLNAVAGLIMHIVLILAFLVLSGGSSESGGLPVPSPTAVAIGLAAAIAVIAASLAVRFTRRLVVERVVPQLRTGWESLQQIGRSPGRIALLFGGSAAITLAYTAAMAASLEAFGSTASLPIVGLLYLTGSAVANAAPTPGGLGAAEAALVASFSLVEEAAIVIPAVFLFRFVTFWLPILPGWLALTWLRSSDRI